VAISGGGRCNVTHACFEPSRLVDFYPRGSRELRSLFARFQPQDTIAWFKARGLKLKTEGDGRLFPISDSSSDVIAALMLSARKSGVQLHSSVRVQNITYKKDDSKAEKSVFEITLASGQTEYFDACVLATGYSPPGWAMAKALGHTILPPVPSLFPFTVKSPLLRELQGISLEKVSGRLLSPAGEKISSTEEGAMLITHTGLSGPVIYRLSARAARELAEHRYQAELILDLLPSLSIDELHDQLEHCFKEDSNLKKVFNTRFEPFSHRLWLALCEAAEIDLEQRADSVPLKNLRRLAEQYIKRLSLPVSGKSPSKEEFVSCGGVSRKEVDFKTMESKRVPNLYFAGEILDIDGLTGGFNFQACWSGGWVVSEAVIAGFQG
jgi:predicted Rossmann fold flavoprotein